MEEARTTAPDRRPSGRPFLWSDALILAGKPAVAVEECDDALSLKPKKPDPIQIKKARALDLAGKKDEAKSVLDEILKRDPENPEAKAARAEIK